MQTTAPRTRTHSHHAGNSPIGIESLEPRCLLASGFNPDGPTISTPADAPTSIITADFDGDSKPDLVLSVGRDIIFQKGGGGGKFGAPRVIARLNTDAGLLGYGDFNGDGRNDLFSVQKETLGGWHRLLVNAGNAQFNIASYGRTSTAVQSVTIGNIDGDAEDEVLLEGRSPLLVATINIIAEPPDEIRVLDPLPLLITTAPLSGPPVLLPFLRFNDLGIAIRGPKFAQPVIQNMLGGAFNNIIVGGEDQSNPTQGWIQVYAFAHPIPSGGVIAFGDTTTGGLPAPLFSPVGNSISLPAIVSSLAAADMIGDSRIDLIASTLRYPLLPTPFSNGIGAFEARTLLLPRTGISPDLAFGPSHTVDSRTLVGPAVGELRTLTPEYRITNVSDMNSDGLPDVGISIVQEFNGGATGPRRVARFVQAIHSDVVGVFGSLIVAQLTARGGPAESALTRPQIFHAADIRNIGRPDLMIAMPQNGSGFTPISIRYNVQAATIFPHT